MFLLNKIRSHKKLSLLSLVLLTLLVAREMGWLTLQAYRSNTRNNTSLTKVVTYWKERSEVYEEVGPDGPRSGVRISRNMTKNPAGYEPDFGYRVQIQHDGETLREVHQSGDDKLPTLEFLIDLETLEYSGLTWTPLFKSFDLIISGPYIGPDRTSGAPPNGTPTAEDRRRTGSASCSMEIFGPCTRATARDMALNSALDHLAGMIHDPEEREEPSVRALNSAAWARVDPDRREKDTDVALALRMTRRGIELDPKYATIRDTHAWALFANGLYDEALVECAKAVELASEDKKEDYQGYFDRMRRLVEAWSAGFPPSPQGQLDHMRAMVEGWDKDAVLLYSSGVLKSPQLVDVDVDVAGSSQMVLVVTEGGDDFSCDWADWIAPRFVTADGADVSLKSIGWIAETHGFGGLQYPTQFDGNLRGDKLRVGDDEFSEGIGTHAHSVILFAVPADAERFLAQAGPDYAGTSQDCGTSIEFQVWVKGQDRSPQDLKGPAVTPQPKAVSLIKEFGPLAQAMGETNKDRARILSGPEEVKLKRDQAPGKAWSVELGKARFRVSIEDKTGLEIKEALRRIERVPPLYRRCLEIVSEEDKDGIAFYDDLGGAAAHGGQEYLNILHRVGAEVIIHEAGHVMEQRARDAEPDILERWGEAIEKDGVSVSPYGDRVVHEDQAEFAKVYALCLDAGPDQLERLKLRSPERYALWERMLRLAKAK